MLNFILTNKKLHLLCLVILLSSFFSLHFPSPAFAADVDNSVLKRLSNLESRWGHLQLGGDFSLQADYKRRSIERYETPDFKSNLNLYLDAQIDRNFYFYLLLSHYDNYGYLNQLFINEAAVRYRSPRLLADLGKFKFTLDPLGLIADHSSSPIQGIALQTGNTNIYLGGFYSRLYLKSKLITEDSVTVTSDDKFGLRIAFPKPGYMLGTTLIHTPTGVLSETAASIDLITNLFGGTLQSELAWYQPGAENYLENKGQGALGGLFTWNKAIADTIYTLNAWYFEKGFAPTSSILNDSYLEKGNIFINNSYGVGSTIQRKFSENWDASISTGLLVSPGQIKYQGPQLTLSTRLRKSFSAVSSLQFGYDSVFEADVDKITLARYNRFSIQLNTVF